MSDYHQASEPPARAGGGWPVSSGAGQAGWADDYDWGLPATAAVTTEYRTARSRRAGTAAVGTVLAVVALCATLTGLLAPVGLVIALVGGALCVAAAITAHPRAIRGLALFGLFTALIALAIAVLAMTKLFTWPNSGVDEISRWHAWLVAHLSWLRRWA